MEKIVIKSAWLSFYKKEKTTVPYIFINEFERENESEPKEIETADDLPF